MSTTTADTFGAKVEEYRERLGMQQKELAERVGLSPSHLNRIEKGTRKRPQIKTVLRMIKALRLKPTEAEEFVQLAGLSPLVLQKNNSKEKKGVKGTARGKAAGGEKRLNQKAAGHGRALKSATQVKPPPMPTMASSAIGIPDSLLGTIGDQIKEIKCLIDSLSFTDEEEEMVASQLDTTERLLKFIAARRKGREEG